MIHEYIEFTENYKGYTLETIKFRRHDRDSYHKEVRVSKNGKSIAIGKTKKSVKDLIDHDCYRSFE